MQMADWTVAWLLNVSPRIFNLILTFEKKWLKRNNKKNLKDTSLYHQFLTMGRLWTEDKDMEMSHLKLKWNGEMHESDVVRDSRDLKCKMAVQNEIPWLTAH